VQATHVQATHSNLVYNVQATHVQATHRAEDRNWIGHRCRGSQERQSALVLLDSYLQSAEIT
jgi:hypothetical protein